MTAGIRHSSAGPNSPRVLIVDDSPENRYVVRRALTRAGMQVVEAGTGAEGLTLGTESPADFDLIVLDVNLPDTTGFELCRRFKGDARTARIPVIHLSQSAVDDGSRVRGLEGGADAYLTDPVHASVLIATVRALLRLRAAEDALRKTVEDADRLSLLNSRLSAATSEDAVLDALLDSLTDPYTIRRAYLFDPQPRATRPRLVYPNDAPDGERLPLDPLNVDRLVAEIFTDDSPHPFRNVYGAAGQQGPFPWLVLPLPAYGREMGTLLIEFAAGITLTEHNLRRLGEASERCGQALERARMFEAQRAIAYELQSSLLPIKLPRVPGLSIAAQYRAGAEGMVVGGDFYDVFAGAGGWGMIIGDVCGRGAAAAARTGLARHTAREAARHDREPAAVLTALERAIDADKRDQLDLISAICLATNPIPDGIALNYAIAGHPLPILIRADGQVMQVGTPGPILGLSSDPRFVTSHALVLSPGDVLFLYTDGVTEARRGGVLFGEARLMELLGEMVRAGAKVDELARAPVEAAAAYNEIHDDDMATLVLRAERQPAPDPS